MTAVCSTEVRRLRLAIRGAVQGVGFRPFVYRLATELGLAGWICNSAQGVVIEVEGERPHVEAFLLRLEPERPPRSFIQSLEPSYLDPVGYAGFEIRPSDPTGELRAAEERLRQIEILRWINYGDAACARLQRVLAVAPRTWR